MPGCEAVGRTADGGIVWIFGGSLGRTSNGAIGERAAVGDAYSVEVPEGADPALAAGLGIAGLAGWLPFAWRAPLTGGEDVLVLGATGSVGLVAVQTAKLLGAGRVVAAGRSAGGLERAADLGADAAVRLDEHGDLVTAFKEAFRGAGPSYVFDALWGEPGAAAVLAAAPKATIVNLGQSAGATAALSSEAVRFKSLAILGFSVYAVSLTTPSPGTFGSTWSRYRSTPSPTRGGVRSRAPGQSSSSYREASQPSGSRSATSGFRRAHCATWSSIAARAASASCVFTAFVIFASAVGMVRA